METSGDNHRLLVRLALLLIFLFAGTFLAMPGLPFLDLPNHVARGYVIGELLWGSSYRDLFAFDLLFTPYILADLILAALTRVCSVELSATLLLSAAFLLPVLALGTYGSIRGLKTSAIIATLLFATYLATSWFFLSAFVSFCLGFALLFFSLTCWELAFAAGIGKKRILWYFCFLLCATLAYLSHLSSFTFLALIIGCMGVLRLLSCRLTLTKVVWSIVPFVIFSVLHLLRPSSQKDLANEWLFRSPLEKLTAIGTMFVRFDYLFDITLFVAFLLFLAFHLRGIFNVKLFRATHALDSDYDIFELGLAALGFILLYLALPVAFSHVYDVDGRALPFAFSFLLLFALRVGERWGTIAKGSEVSASGRHTLVRISPTFSVAVSFGFAILNFLYLLPRLLDHNRYLVSYNQAVREIPAHRTVLPIVSTPEEGRIQTGLHNGALYTAWGKGVTPYIFNSSLGQPVTYFHYKQVPYHPFQFWYQRNLPVDWTLVESTYQYVIITKPYDATRINLPRAAKMYENESAIVFRTNSARE